MRLLIIHHEAEYFAGAEKVLGYYLEGLAGSEHQVTVAAVQKSRVAELIPPSINACWLPSNARFSLSAFWRQARTIRQLCPAGFDLLHGWAARDWELTAVCSKLTELPSLGTLHDHPHAPFISRSRQRLMAWSAAWGLTGVACVSDALRQGCVQAGYSPRKLRVVHNGLPPASGSRPERPASCFRLGYLGVFAERKGLRGLFEILDQFAQQSSAAWELSLAGQAQEAEGQALVREIRERWSSRPWWPQVQWRGWVKQPLDFLASLDLLICPSSEFDPFPTVLLEAGQAGTAVLGARVGGVSEIVENGVTGWLFEPRHWGQAAGKLREILATPSLAAEAGRRARQRVQKEFAVSSMVSGYIEAYRDLVHSRSRPGAPQDR